MSAAVCPKMVDVSWRSIYRSPSHGQLVYAMQAEFRVLDSLAYRLSTGRDAIPGQIVTSGGCQRRVTIGLAVTLRLARRPN